MVPVESPKSPWCVTSRPPTRGSSSASTNQRRYPGPVATDSQTSSTVPATSTSTTVKQPSPGRTRRAVGSWSVECGPEKLGDAALMGPA